MSDWDSQRSAFEQAIDVLDGRIDYVLPIAGIGERRSFPNKPDATTFEKPDLKVVEVDEIGVIYSVSLAVQHLRQVGKGKRGVKGRSKTACHQSEEYRNLLTSSRSPRRSVRLRLLHPHHNPALHRRQAVSIASSPYPSPTTKSNHHATAPSWASSAPTAPSWPKSAST